MPDEQETQTPERKVIDGNVNAAASVADVALNAPSPAVRFAVSEQLHHRYECDPDTGRERSRISMLEFTVTQGTPPSKWSRFQGVGVLTAETPPKPQGMGTVRREYRFNIYVDNLEEAWEKFDAFNERGSTQAKDSFQREFAEWQQAQAGRLALLGKGGLITPDGRPLG